MQLGPKVDVVLGPRGRVHRISQDGGMSVVPPKSGLNSPTSPQYSPSHTTPREGKLPTPRGQASSSTPPASVSPPSSGRFLTQHSPSSSYTSLSITSSSSPSSSTPSGSRPSSAALHPPRSDSSRNIAAVASAASPIASIHRQSSSLGPRPGTAKSRNSTISELVDVPSTEAFIKDAQGDVNVLSNAVTAAAWKGKVDVVRTLLAANALPERGPAQGYNGATPIIRACENVHLETVQLLLSAGAKADTRDHEGRTPLTTAVRAPAPNKLVQESKFKLVDLLLSSGADVNAKERRSGMSPLHFAAGLTEFPLGPQLVELLIQTKAEINATCTASKRPPLAEAVEVSNQWQSAKLLLDARANPNWPPQEDLPLNRQGATATLLLLAVRNNNPPLIEVLLSAGAEVHGPQSTQDEGVLSAVQDGQALSMLIGAGALPHKSDLQNRRRAGVDVNADLDVMARVANERRIELRSVLMEAMGGLIDSENARQTVAATTVEYVVASPWAFEDMMKVTE